MIMPVKSTYPALTSDKSKLSNVYGAGDKTEEEPKSAEQAEKENESSGKPIGLDEIHEAMQTFRKYQNSKKQYDERFKQAFKEYNLLYTEATAPQIKTDDNGRPRKVLVPKRKGAQALNVIMNKHADAMDNYPEIICLPRAQDDEQAAKTLNSVIPCIHKRNGFIRTYSDEQLDKFVGGCGCYAVLWDKTAENGLGDIAISRVDILNLFGSRILRTYRTVPMYSLPDITMKKESERYIPSLKAFQLPLSDLWNTKPTTTATSRMIK